MFRLPFRCGRHSKSKSDLYKEEVCPTIRGIPQAIGQHLFPSVSSFKEMNKSKVALVHYWLVGMRGGERVLESLCRMYPTADLYTNVYVPSAVSSIIRSHNVRTTFIQRLPFSSRLYQKYLPLMPSALEQLDLSGYRLVISSESGPAKNVIVDPDAVHLCYCHTPMRYLWDMTSEYAAPFGPFLKALMHAILHYLRMADVTSAARVDAFVANSSFTARRITRFWRRDATVLPPPVNVGRFRVTCSHGGYYLWLGQLCRYKQPELAVKAFNKSGRHLIVAGDGPELSRCRKLASKNTSFVGKIDDEHAAGLLENCRALVFTGTEDFGIVPVEAMACGKPVIAYQRGGVLDTVRDGITGLFFTQPTPDCLNDAIDRFEINERSFAPAMIRTWAEQFDEPRFRKSFQEIIDAYTRNNRHGSFETSRLPSMDISPVD